MDLTRGCSILEAVVKRMAMWRVEREAYWITNWGMGINVYIRCCAGCQSLLAIGASVW